MNDKVFIDPNVLTEEMISVGGDQLSKLLCALEVEGIWCEGDVIPDVFRAMVAVAPRFVCECLQSPPEDEQRRTRFLAVPFDRTERRPE